jgi:hypothetical protein
VNAVADKPRLFVFNLITLLILGVALSFWTLYYTESFPVVGGLLGLTGVFAWIGFVANMLTGERKKAMQGWLDQRVLQSNVPWVLSLLVLGGFAGAVAARSGSLVIDSRADDVVRLVSVRRAQSGGGTDGALRLNVAPRSENRSLLWTRWLQPTRYRVTAAGLPDVYVDILPARRTRLTLPDAAFSAPVVLVRADVDVYSMLEGAEFRLQVMRNEHPLGVLAPYDGHSVWIGAGPDVAIPQHLNSRWRAQEGIQPEAMEAVLSVWMAPKALASDAQLEFGDQLRAVVVRTSDKLEIGAGCATLAPPATRAEYPQELVIHENEKC